MIDSMNVLPIMTRLLLALLVAVAPLTLPCASGPQTTVHHDQSALQPGQDGVALLFLASRTDGDLTLSMPRKAMAAPIWISRQASRPGIGCLTEDVIVSSDDNTSSSS